jgi:hypothetical protein
MYMVERLWFVLLLSLLCCAGVLNGEGATILENQLKARF